MSSPPSAVTAILARVAELSQAPAAVVGLSQRFGVQLSSATTPTIAITDTTTATAATTESTIASRVTSAGATVDTTTGVATPTGVWVDRIPNARGKALVPTIAAAAAKYNLDPAFLAAVFWTESSYTPDAVSRTGAIGLGQLMPETAEWLGVDPWDPTQNADGAARLYRYFLDRNNGDYSLAIASYAAGPGAVKRAGGIPDQFTANYITKLLARTDYLAGRRATQP